MDGLGRRPTVEPTRKMTQPTTPGQEGGKRGGQCSRSGWPWQRSLIHEVPPFLERSLFGSRISAGTLNQPPQPGASGSVTKPPFHPAGTDGANEPGGNPAPQPPIFELPGQQAGLGELPPLSPELRQALAGLRGIQLAIPPELDARVLADARRVLEHQQPALWRRPAVRWSMAAGLLVVGGIGIMVAHQASRPPAGGPASPRVKSLALEAAPAPRAGADGELLFKKSAEGTELADERKDATIAGAKVKAETTDLLSSASADSAARSAGAGGARGAGDSTRALGEVNLGLPRWDIVNAYQLARQLDRKQQPEARWDVNHDGVVDQRDVVLVAQAAVKLPPPGRGVGPDGRGAPGNPAGATGGGL